MEECNGILVGVLGIDAGGDEIFHNVEDLAAAVENKGSAGGMDQIHNVLVAGDDPPTDLVMGQKRLTVEAQVITHAADTVGVCVIP